jgi:hypothetical protein
VHVLNLHSQIQLELPPFNFSISHVVPDLPLLEFPLTLRYLGEYSNIFDNQAKEPMPIWTTINWMLEDYGLT